jgi:hypothetical protein
MMDRREALLLVDRLKHRTRDPEVLTLCEYVHGTAVPGTIQGFRRPDDHGTPPAVIPSTSCPVCAARRAAETARKKRWRQEVAYETIRERKAVGGPGFKRPPG